eukprot:2545207-Pleurochrysis_carterae.AAC.1
MDSPFLEHRPAPRALDFSQTLSAIHQRLSAAVAAHAPADHRPLRTPARFLRVTPVPAPPAPPAPPLQPHVAQHFRRRPLHAGDGTLDRRPARELRALADGSGECQIVPRSGANRRWLWEVPPSTKRLAGSQGSFADRSAESGWSPWHRPHAHVQKALSLSPHLFPSLSSSKVNAGHLGSSSAYSGAQRLLST